MTPFLAFARKYIWVLFLLFLAIDFVQSNYHYSNLPIDGDLPRIAAPFRWYEDIMADPLGVDAISENKKYAGAGRYISHASTVFWFHKVFKLVAKFSRDHVQAIFMTSTLLVALIHICFIWLAIQYTRTRKKWNLKSAVVIALLASVLIQYNNFYDCIGIIDRSIAYVFFYALPIMVVLIYFLPFFKFQHRKDYRISIWQHVGLIILAPIMAFGCALTQPIVFIISLLYFFGLFIRNPFFKLKKNKGLILQLAFLLVLCLYTFYVSKYNIESEAYKPLAEKYTLLLKGLYRIFTLTLAWPVIILFIAMNCVIFYKHDQLDWKQLRPILFFVLGFCAVYTFLLPLGGYRVYRPYIIRYDTFIPVTLGFIFLLLYTTNNIYKVLTKQSWFIYTIAIFCFALIFYVADNRSEKEANYCQQGTFYEIEKSNEAIIRVPINCNTMTWDISDAFNPEHLGGMNIMFKKWGLITEEQRVEFFKP